MPQNTKPTKIKIAEGNPGKKKLTPELEPKFVNELPDPPSHLSDYAREEWESMARDLHDAGVLTRVDGRGFASYCEAYAMWRTCCEEIKKMGGLLIIEDHYGDQKVNPYVKLSFECMTKLLAFLVQYGLTPASRSKITIHDPKKEEDPFEEFQKKKEEARGKLRQINGTN